MIQTEIRGGISVPKDDTVFNHYHFAVDYIVKQVCMSPSTTTMSVCHVCHVYAQAARLILQTRAHNSQPVIGKGARRAAAGAAAPGHDPRRCEDQELCVVEQNVHEDENCRVPHVHATESK